ncbi:MAG TPA: hypothetical protein VJ838_14530 [Gaiellaceae bacterium]|nr:hypothetical protein [Gaiellaceae bacterium]
MHRRVTISIAVVVVALASVATAYGKGSESVRIVAPSGKVGWVRAAAARAWWKDFAAGNAADCTCRTANGAANFAYRLVRRWGSPPRKVLLVQSEGAPMLYYPAKGTAPPYLLVPGSLGVRHLQWDDWRVVTPRMQRLMAAALDKGTISTYTGSGSGFPIGWGVGGGLGGVLVVGLIFGAWRRPRLRPRLSP